MEFKRNAISTRGPSSREYYPRSRAGRCSSGVRSYPGPSSIHGSSPRPPGGQLCLLQIRPPYSQSTWPSTSRTSSGYENDHSLFVDVWWGFTDASDRSRLERQLASLRRAGFLPPDCPSFDELARNADASLFRSICSNPDHLLRHYFTYKKPKNHNLRPRDHSFALPSKDPRNFVSRTLYGALLNRD